MTPVSRRPAPESQHEGVHTLTPGIGLPQRSMAGSQVVPPPSGLVQSASLLHGQAHAGPVPGTLVHRKALWH